MKYLLLTLILSVSVFADKKEAKHVYKLDSIHKAVLDQQKELRELHKKFSKKLSNITKHLSKAERVNLPFKMQKSYKGINVLNSRADALRKAKLIPSAKERDHRLLVILYDAVMYRSWTYVQVSKYSKRLVNPYLEYPKRHRGKFMGIAHVTYPKTPIAKAITTLAVSVRTIADDIKIMRLDKLSIKDLNYLLSLKKLVNKGETKLIKKLIKSKSGKVTEFESQIINSGHHPGANEFVQKFLVNRNSKKLRQKAKKEYPNAVERVMIDEKSGLEMRYKRPVAITYNKVKDTYTFSHTDGRKQTQLFEIRPTYVMSLGGRKFLISWARKFKYADKDIEGYLSKHYPARHKNALDGRFRKLRTLFNIHDPKARNWALWRYQWQTQLRHWRSELPIEYGIGIFEDSIKFKVPEVKTGLMKHVLKVEADFDAQAKKDKLLETHLKKATK